MAGIFRGHWARLGLAQAPLGSEPCRGAAHRSALGIALIAFALPFESSELNRAPYEVGRRRASGSERRLSVASLGVACLAAVSGCRPPGEPQAARAEPAPELRRVRVDQYGYWPESSKIALWLSAAGDPTTWELLDEGGQLVASGTTNPFGRDGESGDDLHRVDFSDFAGSGTGFRLRVGEHESRPFALAEGLYEPLFVDAVRYFYLNRSGVPIEMPFAGEPALARPAGHVSDSAVPCIAGSGCDYQLDVRGGWYDAGDYGKYVVNGGLAAWLLLSAYEVAASRNQAAWMSDGQLRIPESGNAVADVLDEVRFEIEFLMKMQVPEGEPLAGMVHHKIHDERWSAMGKLPTPKTEIARFLHPPSTAAALNLAAAGAAAARSLSSFDPQFAADCLAAARRAFAAAQRHPDRIAPSDSHSGGGPYGDTQLSDDFYWAAAELWRTTGEPQYAEVVRSSPHFGQLGETEDYPSTFNWATTDALGSMSLMLHDDKLEPEERARLEAALVRRADRYLALIDAQGYHFPFQAGEDGYPWGSNSFVSNNGVVLAFAHLRTGRPEYLQGAQEALHYLLGRNTNDVSYVSGYGERSLSHPHHRFWAPSADPELPPPPPGALSGGPNSRLQDPPMRSRKQGCPPQACYLDELEAFSVNEVAINWNASLAWLAAYLAGARQSVAPPPPAPLSAR